MNRAIRVVAFLALAACGGGASSSHTEPAADRERDRAPRPPDATYRNPVVAVNCPDPGVLADGDVFYAVCTSNNNQAERDKFPVLRSADLVSWQPIGHLFPADAI